MRSRRSRICWGSSAAIPPTLGGLTFPVQTCSVAVSPASHAGQADVLQQFGFHESSQSEAPDPDGRGLDCPVWVVRPLGPHRFYSTSGNRWLGGRDDHLPAGATALAALDRRGDIVHREFPISAARAAGRGVVL